MRTSDADQQQRTDLALFAVTRAAVQRRDGWDGWFLLCGGLILISTSSSTNTTFGTDTITICVPADSSREAPSSNTRTNTAN